MMAQNPVRPGNREKGWNDPPEFLHNLDDPSSANVKRTILNKRVSHNLNKNEQDVSETSKTTILNAPPVFTMPPIGTAEKFKLGTDSIQSNGTESIKSEDISVEEIENILNTNVKILKDNGLGDKACDDILKRVKIFVTNWPKLNPNVKIKMYSLAKALEKSELNTANDIHLHLILDYSSEVSQWMVGLKKLIHELVNFKKKSENLATKNNDEETPEVEVATT